jgi:hypothetical protein
MSASSPRPPAGRRSKFRRNENRRRWRGSLITRAEDVQHLDPFSMRRMWRMWRTSDTPGSHAEHGRRRSLRDGRLFVDGIVQALVLGHLRPTSVVRSMRRPCSPWSPWSPRKCHAETWGAWAPATDFRGSRPSSLISRKHYWWRAFVCGALARWAFHAWHVRHVGHIAARAKHEGRVQSQGRPAREESRPDRDDRCRRDQRRRTPPDVSGSNREVRSGGPAESGPRGERSDGMRTHPGRRRPGRVRAMWAGRTRGGPGGSPIGSTGPGSALSRVRPSGSSASHELVEGSKDRGESTRVQGADPAADAPAVDRAQLKDQGDRGLRNPLSESGWTRTIPGKRSVAVAVVSGTTRTTGNAPASLRS